MDGLRACVHCGICLPQCPTYRVLGEEMDSPRGRLYLMRAAAEGRIGLTPTIARHIELCRGCRACETACPSGVPFGQLLEATRGQFERLGVTAPTRDGATLRFILETFPHPGRLGLMLRALRLYQRTGLQALARGLGLLTPFRKLRAMERCSLGAGRRAAAGADPGTGPSPRARRPAARLRAAPSLPRSTPIPRGSSRRPGTMVVRGRRPAAAPPPARRTHR
jgi:ferredoxin